MTTWFTADLHIGHKNVIKYCDRPWREPTPDVKAMDAALIDNWNAVVQPEDDVWNLGDFAFCCAPAYALDALKRLNGRHHLVMGNHDEMLRPSRLRFADVHDGLHEIKIEGQSIVLCHYAMREWHHNLRGAWHLFGHTHGLLRPYGKSVDVGVDNTREVLSLYGAWGAWVDADEGETLEIWRRKFYRPVSFAEVKAFMDTRPVGAHVQFGGFPAKEQEVTA